MWGITFAAIIQTEFRLLFRKPGFWLYAGAMVLLAIAVVTSGFENRSWLDRLVFLVNNIAFFQLPLLAVLAASCVIRNKSHAGEWLWTTPLDSSLLIFGQALALILTASAVLAAVLVFTWLSLLIKGALLAASFSLFMFYGLFLLIPITLLQIGLVFSLALWIRQGVIVIALATLPTVLSRLGVLLPTASLIFPLNYTLQTLNLDKAVGFGAESPLLFPLLGFYSFLSLGLISFSMLGFRLVESRSGLKPYQEKIITSLLLFFTIAAGTTFFSYSSNASKTIVPPPVTEQVNVWEVQESFHKGTISGNTVNVTSTFMLLNTSGQEFRSLFFTLNTGLQVTDAAINGQTASANREGESIRLIAADSTIMPGDVVSVELTYAGYIQIMREDFQRVINVIGHSSPSFSKPVQAYLDQTNVYFQRDGDWLAWPQNPGPHLAALENAIQLTIDGHLPVASSGELILEGQTTTYQWLGKIPKLLLIAGPYRQDKSNSSGVLFIPPHPDPRDTIRITSALDIWLELNQWFNPDRETGPNQIVILPYADEVIIGGSLVGLPETSVTMFPSGLIYDKNEWPELERNLAIAISNAWLVDTISWAPGKLGTAGVYRSWSTTCSEETDESGQQICETVGLGEPSPQAPFGRLVESESANHLRIALSVVIGQKLTAQVSNFSYSMDEELELWTSLSSPPENAVEGYDQFWPLEKINYELISKGLLPGSTSLIDGCKVAKLVLPIDLLYEDLGKDRFADFIQELSQTYPIGGEPLEIEHFWSLASQYDSNLRITGYVDSLTACEVFGGEYEY